jgi:uncharacterized protein YndB with AHSA1/START domain
VTPDLEGTIEIRRRLPAPPTTVFALWTQPESIRLWFGGEATRVGEVHVDLRPGGEYLIKIEAEEGPSQVFGRFLDVEAPNRLRYTWTFVSAMGRIPETTVEVQFLDLGGATEILLRHGPFPTSETFELHHSGWEACFGVLHELSDAAANG